jgi:hypothetical protein
MATIFGSYIADRVLDGLPAAPQTGYRHATKTRRGRSFIKFLAIPY